MADPHEFSARTATIVAPLATPVAAPPMVPAICVPCPWLSVRPTSVAEYTSKSLGLIAGGVTVEGVHAVTGILLSVAIHDQPPTTRDGDPNCSCVARIPVSMT